MKNTRIRYTEKTANKIESVQEFVARGHKMKVEISGANDNFWISINSSSGGPSSIAGPFPSLHEVKKAAKISLIAMGVSFADEERNRRPKRRGPGRPKGSKNAQAAA